MTPEQWAALHPAQQQQHVALYGPPPTWYPASVYAAPAPTRSVSVGWWRGIARLCRVALLVRAAPRRSTIEVRTYKRDKDLQRDAERRLAQGWTMQAQVAGQGRVTVTRVAAIGPLALFARKGHTITVTWTR